jgi:hypothetical protein
MLVPLIVVEVGPEPIDGRAQTVLLEACTSGLARGRCVAADHRVDAATQRVSAFAVVSLVDEHTAEIEVGRKRDGRARWVARSLSFRPLDEQLERQRTIGFTIATLAGDMDPELRREPAPSDPPAQQELPAATPTPRPPVPHPGAPNGDAAKQDASRQTDAAAQRSPLRLSAQGVVGPGLQGEAPRAGGRLRCSWLFAHGFSATGSASAAWAPEVAPTGVVPRWFTLSFGPGYALSWRHFRLDTRLELLVEQLRVSAEHPVSRESDAAERSATGLAVGVDLAFPDEGHVGGLLSFDAWQLFEATEVTYFDASVTTAPDRAFTAGLGVFVQW